MNANRNIKINTGKSAKTTEKLSSGYRINRAADDAAGLSISEKMRRLIRGLTQASRNCQDGISMVQTAEGALNEVHDMLQRMNELAVQSANGTNTAEDREALQKEFEHIQEEIDRVSQTTTFNAMRLFADEDSSAGTANAGDTNGTNTPAVTSLDETGQAPAARMMGMTRTGGNIDITGGTVTATGGVTVGDFTLSGTGLTEGVDYSYSDDTLTILSDKNIIVTGTGAATTNKIVIQDGITANVTLNNVNIDISSTWGERALKIDGTATLNLTVTGNNILKSGAWGAGLEVDNGATLVITEQSTGVLSATGGDNGAGIGGGENCSCGNIIIRGGSITATGGGYAAGLGGGYTGGCGNIDIYGGSITATGGIGAAGIGGGYVGSASGSVEIFGGEVTSKGGAEGAGIGSGCTGGFVDINIYGGKVDATGGSWAAGIGFGYLAYDVNTTISGGEVTATGGEYGAGIGGCYQSDGSNTIISGGNVRAIGTNGGAAIGSGYDGSGDTFTTGTNGNAIIDATNGDISDTGSLANWSGIINGVVYGNPALQGSSTIDLSTLTGDLELTDTGYKIGSTEYVCNGPYTFTGSTSQNIIVSTDTTINMNGVTGGNFMVTNNADANVVLTGTNTMNRITVDNGSVLNTSGSGTMNVAGSMTNSGKVNIGSGTTIENNGSVMNGGTIQNAGNIENNGTLYNNGGALNNRGEIDNNGMLKNDGSIDNSSGTVNNNSGGTLDNMTGSTFDNTSGTVTDNGGTIIGTINGNQPTTGGGSGSTGGETGGGSGTGGATVGEAKNSWWIQAGSEAGQGINIQIGAMNTKVLGIEKDTVNILTQESSGNAITAVSGAIEKLSGQRSRLGAYQNRLEHTIYNLDNIVENTTAAESQIRDADMAELMVEHSSNNIIMQAAQAMLAQANHQPDGVLQLLQ